MKVGDCVQLDGCNNIRGVIVGLSDMNHNWWDVKWVTHSGLVVPFPEESLRYLSQSPINKNIDDQIRL